eukprot:6201265-Pleurochrysis_carterae.AAC.8
MSPRTLLRAMKTIYWMVRGSPQHLTLVSACLRSKQHAVGAARTATRAGGGAGAGAWRTGARATGCAGGGAGAGAVCCCGAAAAPLLYCAMNCSGVTPGGAHLQGRSGNAHCTLVRRHRNKRGATSRLMGGAVPARHLLASYLSRMKFLSTLFCALASS